MALSSSQRDAIRTEYQNGAFVRALARSHGVHESSIREMASKRGWTRDPQATERIRQANQPKGLDGIAGRYFPRRPTHWRPVPRYMSYWHEAMPPEVVERIEGTRIAVERYEAEARAEIDRVAERARAEIDELVIKGKADAVAKANADDLARAEKLDQIFQRLCDLLEEALQLPKDEAGKARQAAALAALLPTRRDRLSAYLLQVGKLAVQIQAVSRRALGLDRPPAEPAPPRPAETPAAKPPKNFDLTFFQSLTTDELRTLWEAGQIMAGKHRPPPPYMPPDDPGDRQPPRSGSGTGSGGPLGQAGSATPPDAVADDVGQPVPPGGPPTRRSAHPMVHGELAPLRRATAPRRSRGDGLLRGGEKGKPRTLPRAPAPKSSRTRGEEPD